MIGTTKPFGNVKDELECTFEIAIIGNKMLFSIPRTLRNIIEPSKEKIPKNTILASSSKKYHYKKKQC